MDIHRRNFFKISAIALGAAALPGGAHAGETPQEGDDPQAGCLVDTTLCIGCRKCEQACNGRNSLPKPAVPFDDPSVFRMERRPTTQAFTVVNEYAGSPSADQPVRGRTFAKVQCMHCLFPACVSACIVGALSRMPDGAVVYDKDICLGCRYCMVACPFQIPSYEYDDPITPRVRKCEFCAVRAQNAGARPACAATCPTEALVFGKRAELLDMAKHRIQMRPDRYVDRVYGENEVGGTSWLYLTGRPAQEIGLIKLPDEPPPHMTESIQHGIFKFGLIPIAVYGVLYGVMWKQGRGLRIINGGGGGGGESNEHSGTIDTKGGHP